MARPPSPESINKAAKVLRRLAAQERLDDDLERAKLLDHAAEICEAKAFVGVIAETFGIQRDAAPEAGGGAR